MMLVETGLTNATECSWFQGPKGDSCSENGTLQSLNQSDNTLYGTIPDEIRLLRSPTVVGLSIYCT
jgi:Leucine-rich repeat (LRR) protein